MSRIDEIRTRMGVIDSDLAALEKTEDPADDEQRELLQARADDLLDDYDKLKKELQPLEEREARVLAVREAARNANNREAGTQQMNNPEFVPTRKSDPFDDMDSVRTGRVQPADTRARALTAIENYAKRNDTWGLEDDGAENATHLVEKGSEPFRNAVARQMLETGTPEYLKTFESYLNDPQGFGARAAMSLVSANGGYLVPFTLDPTIILTNAGSANPYRRVANMKTTTTNDWNGVTSAGVSAAWVAEGIEASDNSPTVGQLKITPAKSVAYLFGSYEVLSDSDFASQLSGLLADAKDRLEETAFAIGTGSGQPKGVIPAGTSYAPAGSVGRFTIGSLASTDIYDLQAALPARWRGPEANNVFLASLPVINRLRNMPKFSGSTDSIVNDSGSTPTLLGKPLLESTSIVSTFTNTSKVLAWLDARQYYIVDRVGMSVVYDNLVLGTNRIPTGQNAWYAFWRVGADVSAATAVRVLTLTT
jgi:HK97 family phage major capsid protein